jgi:phosphate transport system protein
MVAPRSAFDRQLRMLENDVLRAAELVETQLVDAVNALQRQNIRAAQRVEAFDVTINRLRYEIEEQAYALLALQQPNAGDMRRIVAAVSIATNLERMGDYAAGIARLVMRMTNAPTTVHVAAFDEMARLATENLRDVMNALSTGDVALARRVVRRDEEIDQRHKAVYDQLIQTMIDDTSTVEQATMLLWVSHNIERFADRICNICERVVYMVTGDLHEPRPEPMS